MAAPRTEPTLLSDKDVAAVEGRELDAGEDLSEIYLGCSSDPDPLGVMVVTQDYNEFSYNTFSGPDCDGNGKAALTIGGELSLSVGVTQDSGGESQYGSDDQTQNSPQEERETFEDKVLLKEWTNDYHVSLDAAMGTYWEGEPYDGETWEMPARESDTAWTQSADYKCVEGDSFPVEVVVQRKDNGRGDIQTVRFPCDEADEVQIEVYVSSNGELTVTKHDYA